MKHIAIAAAAATLVGCAIAPGPGVIGNGDYLQILDKSGRVAWEMNTRMAGHKSCQNQAALLKGAVAQCAHVPATTPLPFSYRVHNTKQTGDGFYPSHPYTARVSTSAGCKAALASELGDPKVVLLEDKCNKA
jgi:hypothetical protein